MFELHVHRTHILRFSGELTHSNFTIEHDWFCGLSCFENWLFGVDIRCEQ